MKKITVVGWLALLIAVIAPIWATFATMFGLKTAAVALISGGLYVANGSKIGNALKITLGFLAGNFWAFFVMKTIGALDSALNINFFVIFFCTLFVYIIVAVFIACYLDKIFDLAAWLAGWAVTLTLLGLMPAVGWNTCLLHTGIAMVGGVWIVAVPITSLHAYILKKKS